MKLLHPNPVLVDVGYIWAKLLRTLNRRQNNQDLKKIYEHFIKEFEDSIIVWGKLSENSVDARKNIGWAKIAVSLGMESLKAITCSLNSNEHA